MILAGQILHVAGLSVINRAQTAGLGQVRVPVDTIREVGNPNIVDKVPGDPDFTFTIESFDCTTDIEALIAGRAATGPASAQAPGFTDPSGTAYPWGASDFNSINIISPWKDPASGSAGTVIAGHILPGYYPRRIRYTFGAVANSSQQVELSGGSFYYGGNGDGTNRAPLEEFHTGDGATTAFATAQPAVPYRIGGAGGTTFKSVFGVIVDGTLQIEGVDFTQSPTNTAAAGVATVTFTVAPANAAVIRFVYFTTTAQSYPSLTDLASTVTTPAAVRGRNICVYVTVGGVRKRIGGAQSATLEATVEATPTREMCNTEIIGETVTGTNVTGDVAVLARDSKTLLTLFSNLTGVATSEVIGWLNTNKVKLTIEIQNPKNPGQVIKTLVVPDAIFQIPGTEARVNQPTLFTCTYEGSTGVYTAYKGPDPSP